MCPDLRVFRKMKSNNKSLLNLSLVLSLGAMVAALSSCGTDARSASPKLPPLQAIDRNVDLEKFMGDWYVIAHIPTFIETEAYNAVESYQMAPDGTVPTTFRFNKGSFDGPVKTYQPLGFIHNREANTEWRMQFIWPFKAAYLITYLSPDYQTTMIGVPDRKYVWIMARTKTMPADKYADLVKILEQSGHDVSRLRKVPQE